MFSFIYGPYRGLYPRNSLSDSSEELLPRDSRGATMHMKLQGQKYMWPSLHLGKRLQISQLHNFRALPWEKGNRTPLQYSCLENPMDGGTWRAALHGVAAGRTRLNDFTFTHWRRKWQPIPVFLPGEAQGQGSLVGCRLWGCTESDMTEAT